MLILAMFCYTTIVSYAQGSADKAGNYSDRFAYSYGLIVGNDVKKMGLNATTFPFESVLKGVEAAFDSKEPKVLEKAAQMAVNEETQQLQKLDKVSNTRTGFAYNYGVLVGINWRTFGMEFKEVSSKDFKSGLIAMLGNQKVGMTVNEAQLAVSVKYQEQEKKKIEKQLRANNAYLEKNGKRKTVETLASGVQYEVLKKGKGKQVTADSRVTLNYTGSLMDGTVFESSANHGGAIEVMLNGVIRGWKEVLPMMKEGDTWKVVIPTHLGYGNRVRGNVPANSLLIYELEVVSVGQ